MTDWSHIPRPVQATLFNMLPSPIHKKMKAQRNERIRSEAGEPQLGIYFSLSEGRRHVKRFLPHTHVFQRMGQCPCPQPPRSSGERLPGGASARLETVNSADLLHGLRTGPAPGRQEASNQNLFLTFCPPSFPTGRMPYYSCWFLIV